jgi:hypothetical protein
MKNLRRMAVIGLAAGGMTLFGAAAASADTWRHYEESFASSHGGGYKGWADYVGPGGWHKGKAYHSNWGAFAFDDKAFTWEKYAVSE